MNYNNNSFQKKEDNKSFKHSKTLNPNLNENKNANSGLRKIEGNNKSSVSYKKNIGNIGNMNYYDHTKSLTKNNRSTNPHNKNSKKNFQRSNFFINFKGFTDKDSTEKSYAMDDVFDEDLGHIKTRQRSSIITGNLATYISKIGKEEKKVIDKKGKYLKNL